MIINLYVKYIPKYQKKQKHKKYVWALEWLNSTHKVIVHSTRMKLFWPVDKLIVRKYNSVLVIRQINNAAYPMKGVLGMILSSLYITSPLVQTLKTS
jgi:hypothetical protein